MKQLREARMRQVVIAEYLQSAPAVTVIRTLHELVERAVGDSDSGFAVALMSLNHALADRESIPYHVRATLYATARRADKLIVARLFFDAAPRTDESHEAFESGRPLRPRGRPLTLGERKSLARSPRRNILSAIARDPHPDVMRIALGNPHLTETDVVQMATRRPALPESLAVIAGAHRWNVRYPVIRALAKNPYTPAHLAIRLLVTLRRADLRAVADDNKLPIAVREQALALLDLPHRRDASRR